MTRLTLAFALFGAMTVVPATAFAMEPYLPKSPKAFTKVDVDSNGKVTATEITPRANAKALGFFGTGFDPNDAVIDAAINFSSNCLQVSPHWQPAQVLAPNSTHLWPWRIMHNYTNGCRRNC